MNKEEMIAHFKERVDDIDKAMSLIRDAVTPTSAVAQILCAISYDIALMYQYQLEKKVDGE